jgi:hypothetical protein
MRGYETLVEALRIELLRKILWRVHFGTVKHPGATALSVLSATSS